MLVHFRKAMTAAALCGTAFSGMLQAPLTVQAVSATPTQLQLFPDRGEAMVNGSAASLEEPAVIIQDAMYIPARWLADQLQLKLSWNEASRTIGLVTPKAYIELDSDRGTVSVNGNRLPFNEVAAIRNDRLLIKLSWIADLAGITYKYDEASKSVMIRYAGQTSTAYKESELTAEDAQPNSRPIAKFAFDKPVYRLGEPVKIIDLSYDPDAEGLPVYEWAGKQEAYFTPGTYPVTLRVKDGKGNVSEPFTKSVEVQNTPYISKTEFPYYTKQGGAVFSFDAAILPKTAPVSPSVPVLVRQPEDRPLVRGMSAAPVVANGFLYQDEVNGSARLYPSYVNGMKGKAQLAIVLRNKDNTKAVRVTTERKSVSVPSVYNPVRGYKTLEGFMTASVPNEELTIEPGNAVLYAVSPELSTGQGFQGIYDIHSDGLIDVSYIMTPPGLQSYDLGKYAPVSLDGAADASGTFPVADVSWQIDAKTIKEPLSLTIGDDQVEPKLKGTDKRSGKEAQHPGYAGVRYRIQLTTSGKMAVALHPRGGFFQGAVRVNGQTLELPEAGLTDKESILLYRSESAPSTPIEIELMATDRTQLPIELIAVPLRDK